MNHRSALRPLALHALLVAAGVLPGTAAALGMGTIQVKSALSQPLDAEIELLEDRPGEAELTTVMLASPDAFKRAGMDRRFFLTGLKFKVVTRPGGRSYVQVRSDEPVREPFLDFLVEAAWPGGNLMRQYTVLLDPPARPWAGVVSPAVSSAAPPMRASAVRSGPQAQVEPTPAARAPWPQVDQFADVGAVTPGTSYGPIRPGDTLWKIAARVRPGNVSQAQAMAAIVRANPGAFLNGDPNRMMAGSTLTIPTAAELGAQSSGDARTQMAPFIPGWQPQVAAAPAPEAAPAPASDATSTADAGGVVNGAAETGQDSASVRLVQAEHAAAGNASGAGTELLLLEESLDAARQENAALKARLEALEAQVAQLAGAMDPASGAQADTTGAPAAAAAPADPALAASAPMPAAAEVPEPATAEVEPAGAAPAMAAADDTAPPAVAPDAGVIAASTPAPAAPEAPMAETGAGSGRTAALAAVAAGLVGGLGFVIARRRGRDTDEGAATPTPVVAPSVATRPAPAARPVVADDTQEIEITGLPGTDAGQSQLDLLAAMLAARNNAGAQALYDRIAASASPAVVAQADALMRART